MQTTRILTWLLSLTFFALILLALSTPDARAADPIVIRVKVNGATSGTCGTSWDTACGLQYGLTTVAITGTELWVASGTYTPTTGTDRTATFQLRDGITLYGGFAGGETLRSQRNFTANVTILSGDIGVPGDTSDNAYNVVTGSGVTNTAVLDGFTVTGGRADGDFLGGGGMYNRSGSPTLTNINFVSNIADSVGGGMYNYEHGDPTLTNVTFSGNSVNWNGGGMVNFRSDPTLTNVTFFGNSAGGVGGGMSNYESSPAFTNVTFSSNFAGWRGGGMDNSYGSSPTLTNVTFFGNSAALLGGGMRNYFDSNPTVRNTIFWENNAPGDSQISNDTSTPKFYDSVVEGGCPPGSSICTHIITEDPRLCVLAYWGGTTQTLPLLPGSSAIDAGDDATCATADQRGKPRVGPCDIGAYESQGFALAKGDPSHDNQSTMVTHPFADPLRVVVSGAYGEPVNGGSVTFASPSLGAGTTPITNAATVDMGLASVMLTANGLVGSYAVTASAFGANSPVTFTLTNLKSSTTTTLVSSANASAKGQTVILTATVGLVSPGSGIPTGTVQFAVDGMSLSGSVALSGGSASISTAALPVGMSKLTAVYSGDANYWGSISNAVWHTVNPALFLPDLKR